jgi:hypothetical protein
MDNDGIISGKARLVTAESVAAACEALVAQDRKPSFRGIIEVLGGGSPNDIQPFFSLWKSNQREASVPMPAPEPPALPRIGEALPEVAAVLEPLAAGLLKAVSGMLERQRADYEGRLVTVQEGAEARILQARYDAEAEVRRAKAEHAAEAEQWQVEEAAILEERRDLIAKVAELEAANVALVSALDEANVRAAEAEEGRAMSRRSYDFCVIERDEARRNLAAETEKVARLEAERAGLQELVESLRSEIGSERDRTERLHRRIEGLVDRLARMDGEGDDEVPGMRGP